VSFDLEGILGLSGNVILTLKLEKHPLFHCFSLGRTIPEAFLLISNLAQGAFGVLNIPYLRLYLPFIT